MAYSMSGSSEQALEKLDEDIGLSPVAEWTKRCAPVPEMGRQIAPRAARAHDPQYGLDKQSVVPAAAGSAALPRQCGSIFAHWASVNTNRSIKSLNHIAKLS
jgi:hypothetical protein